MVRPERAKRVSYAPASVLLRARSTGAFGVRREVPMRNRNIKAGVIITGVILLLYSSVAAYRTMYYSERNRIRAHLEALPNVEIINISGDEHLTYFHTKFVDIRLKDQPNSFIGLEVPAWGILHESDHIFLSQIGPWILSSQGHTYIHGKDQTTGEATQERTECWYGSIDIGSAGLVADQLPVGVKTLEDIISNYSQLEGYFAGRPEQNEGAGMVGRAGNRVTCYLPSGCN